MKKNTNRRKLFLSNKKNLFYFFFYFFLIVIISLLYINKTIILDIVKNNIQVISKKLEYQFVILEVSGIKELNYDFLEDITSQYYKSSIFLLPLDKISKQIKENSWVKKVKLNTNYKNTLYVDILEYEPIGIYSFNNRYFYFDEIGKIIEEVEKNSELFNDFILFEGQSSNLHAKTLISIFNNLNFLKKFKIIKVNYINKRRFNIHLNNNTILFLSEDDPKKSLENFIKIEKKISETELNDIKTFDLRNVNKTIIVYNND